MDKLKIYEVELNDIDFEGMKAISLVEYPAIEKNFIYFSKDFKLKDNDIVYKDIKPDACEHCIRLYDGKKFTYGELKANGDNTGLKPKDWKPVLGKTHPNCKCELKFEKTKMKKQSLTLSNDEKHIITGPVLIPDLLIYRKNEKEDYYIKFSKDIIEKLSINFFNNFKQKNITLDHEYDINNVVVIESWIINESKNDKSNTLGFDLPVGTWMVSMKINNDKVWRDIKNNNISGFSIEAFLSNTLIEQIKNNNDDNDEKIIDELEKVDYEKFTKDELENLLKILKG